MDLQTLASLIQNVGFPIVVAGYLLYSVNGTLNKINDALNTLRGEIGNHTQVCEKMMNMVTNYAKTKGT